MAKKLGLVKCFYCNEYFSRELTEFVQINKVRYAHKSCYDKHLSEQTQEEKDINALHCYIKKLFDLDNLTQKIIRQIKDYHDNKQYTYSGMLKTLTYFYQVKGNSIDKANGGIGIIPYVYDEAKNYYMAIWIAQQQNQNKPIQQYKPNIIEIKIPPPVRKEKRKKKFAFLDEGED